MKSPLGAAVYVSYAWGDASSAEAVDELRHKFDETFITFKPDKYTLQAGDSFGEFIDEIGKANCIIILFSEAYFQSFYCMLELAKIIEYSKQTNQGEALENHLVSRVIGIQVSDLNASCISQQDLDSAMESAEVEKEFVRLKDDETVDVPENARIRVTNIPYKSEPDQALIKANYDDFNDVFARKLNHTSVSDACFGEIIQKSRQNYIRQLRGNRLFNEASASLCDETCKALDSVLQNSLSEDETVELKDKEQKIACLLTLPSSTLLETLYEAQNSDEAQAELLKAKVSELLMRLLPFYCQQEYATKIKTALLARQQSATHNAINTRYVLPISVENMMAAIDEREVGFIAVPISAISDDKKLLVDNKYCMYLSPEGGEDSRKTYISDTQTDLANSLGLSSMDFLSLTEKSHDRRIADTRNRLLTAFTINPEIHKDQKIAKQNEAINRALTKKKLGEKGEKPHRYFIVPSDDAEAGFWDEYAREVHKISPKLVVLRLKTRNYDNFLEEAAFFDDIPQLLN